MKKKIYSISIGIPAYNEEENIGQILHSILTQREDGFLLKEVIVVSDGSTDDTVSIVRQLRDKRIRLIAWRTRYGKTRGLNEIFFKFTGDILFLIDADIKIKDKLLFSNIIKKSCLEKDGLVAINAEPVKGTNFFESCLNYSVRMKREVGERWNRGRNYLTFRGCFLGLWGKFAKSLRLVSNIVNDDTYLYFSAMEKGYSPRYLSSEKVFYKSPVNFIDHKMQSDRFRHSKDELKKLFPSYIENEYEIPYLIFIFIALKLFLLNPLYSIGYLAIFIFTRLRNKIELESKWNIALTTKRYK